MDETITEIQPPTEEQVREAERIYNFGQTLQDYFAAVHQMTGFPKEFFVMFRWTNGQVHVVKAGTQPDDNGLWSSDEHLLPKEKPNYTG